MRVRIFLLEILAQHVTGSQKSTKIRLREHRQGPWEHLIVPASPLLRYKLNISIFLLYF